MIECLSSPARTRRSSMGLGVALTLLAAACSPAKAPPTAPPPPPTVVAQTPPPRPKPVERPTEAPPQHKIALLAPMTGVNAAIGQSFANAANLALLDRNSQRIKLTVYNTTPGAVSAAQRALADGSTLIVGPFLGSETRQIAPVAAAARVPVLSFSNDASVAGDGVYLMGYMPEQETERVVAFAARQGAKRFAALTPNDAYGARVSASYAAAVKRVGGQLVAVQSYPRDRTKIAAAARRVAKYDERLARARANVQAGAGGVVNSAANTLPAPDFDVLMIAEAGSLTRAFLPALAQYGVTANQVRFLGPGLWSTDQGLAREPGLQGAWFATVPDATFAQIAERLRQRFGLNASRFASLSYDAILLATAADAKGWAVGTPFPVRMLTDSGGYTGVDGLFRILPNGLPERGLEVRELRGKFVTVDAAPQAFGAANTPIN